MTRKPEVEGERGEVVILTEQIERSCQSQLQLIAIKRYSFDALENLCQVYRRDPDLGGDIGQSPPATQIRRHHQLCVIHSFLAPDMISSAERRAPASPSSKFPQRSLCRCAATPAWACESVRRRALLNAARPLG